MTTVAHTLPLASKFFSSRISLCSPPHEPTQQVMQPYPQNSVFQNKVGIVDPFTSTLSQGGPAREPFPSTIPTLSSLHTSPPAHFGRNHHAPSSPPHGNINPRTTSEIFSEATKRYSVADCVMFSTCSFIHRPAHPYSVPGPATRESLDNLAPSLSSNSNLLSDASTAFNASNTLLMNQPGEVQQISTATNRCRLHIRQQPRAARAGPDGKDRRY